MKGDGFHDVRTVLLCGEEAFLTDTYEKRLTARFVEPAVAMLDSIRFDAEEAEADDIIAACDTLPMISQKRVVIVAGCPSDEKFHASAKATRLASYLPTVPDSSLLIFTATAFPTRPALYKSIVANGKVYEFGRLDRDNMKAFVRKHFKAEGARVADDAVDEMIRASGYFDRDSVIDLFSVDGDIKRVAAYAAASGDGSVGMVDIAACMDTSEEVHVFALLDAVSSGRKGDALELLEQILAGGEVAFRLLALLIGQFELMLGYREMKDRSFSFAEIGKALNIKSDFRLKKAAGFADRYSAAVLMHWLERLYRVDRDIKTGFYGDRLALTMFIAEM
jgi:DNA polymerase-3 subunit delta